MLTLESLNQMASNNPDGVAFTEKGSTISFTRLKRLVDKVSSELFEGSEGVYAQHTENSISKNIITLCADNVGINTLLNIKASISKEMLAATIKANHIDVLYTDSMDKIWKVSDNFGLSISSTTPIELFHNKVWKVKFRGNQDGGIQIDEEEIKFRYNEWQEFQKDYHPPPHP